MDEMYPHLMEEMVAERRARIRAQATVLELSEVVQRDEQRLDALVAERDAYRQALVRIFEHYHYPGGHETPAYEIANKALGGMRKASTGDPAP